MSTKLNPKTLAQIDSLQEQLAAATDAARASQQKLNRKRNEALKRLGACTLHNDVVDITNQDDPEKLFAAISRHPYARHQDLLIEGRRGSWVEWLQPQVDEFTAARKPAKEAWEKVNEITAQLDGLEDGLAPIWWTGVG